VVRCGSSWRTRTWRPRQETVNGSGTRTSAQPGPRSASSFGAEQCLQHRIGLHLIAHGEHLAEADAVIGEPIGLVTLVVHVDFDEAGTLEHRDELFPGADVGDLASDPAGDLLVNATPLGMAGQPWPRLPLGGLAPGATIFDMVYAPARTELIAAAEARGLRPVGGATMLLFQAAEAFATFFESAAPVDLGDGLVEQLAS